MLASAAHSLSARRGGLATDLTADMLDAYPGFSVHALLQASLQERMHKKSRIPDQRIIPVGGPLSHA